MTQHTKKRAMLRPLHVAHRVLEELSRRDRRQLLSSSQTTTAASASTTIKTFSGSCRSTRDTGKFIAAPGKDIKTKRAQWTTMRDKVQVNVL